MTPRLSANKTNLIAGVLVVAAVAGWAAAFINIAIMPLATGRGSEVAMPDLRLMTWEEADSICSAAGLVLAEVRFRPDDAQMVGTIIDQFPLWGAAIKPGRDVEVVIADRAALTACPSVIGHSAREAAIMADSSGMGLDFDAIKYRHSEVEPEGVVIEQSPPPNTGVLKGTELWITVSLGKASADAFVPNLIGLNLAEMDRLAAKYSLVVGSVTRYADRSRREGTIIGQSPMAGDSIPPDRRISLTISVATPDSSPGDSSLYRAIEQPG